MALRQTADSDTTLAEVKLLLGSLNVLLFLAMSLGLLVGIALLWLLTRY